MDEANNTNLFQENKYTTYGSLTLLTPEVSNDLTCTHRSERGIQKMTNNKDGFHRFHNI